MLCLIKHLLYPLHDVMATAMEILSDEHDPEVHPHITATQAVAQIQKFMDEMFAWAESSTKDEL